MSARMKTWIPLSLALHLAVLAWAAPARRPQIAVDASLPRWDAMMVDLPAPAGTVSAAARELLPLRTTPPVKEEEPGEASTPDPKAVLPPPREAGPRDVAEGMPEGNAAAAGGTEAGAASGVPARIVRNEEFARMSYVREMIAKTASYCRSAPKGFEGILRSALPPGALRENGSATVSIGLSPSGGLGDVDVRSDSPALLSALRLVPWESAPLPSRYRIPCAKVELNVSVTGERLSVGVKIL